MPSGSADDHQASSSSPDSHKPSCDADIVTARRTTTLELARSHLGLNPSSPIDPDHNLEIVHHRRLFWPRVRIALREPFAEFFGVVVMVLFGNGSVAQVLLSEGEQSAMGKGRFGDYQSISWG